MNPTSSITQSLSVALRGLNEGRSLFCFFTGDSLVASWTLTEENFRSGVQSGELKELQHHDQLAQFFLSDLRHIVSHINNSTGMFFSITRKRDENMPSKLNPSRMVRVQRVL